MIHEDFTEAQLVETCAGAMPAADHADLLTRINAEAGDTPFRHALTRAGWYRIGGVVTAGGERVATSLRQWAEAESGGDMFALYEAHADSRLATTRFDGKMHYFVAPIGERARDFIQLEVEELVEVVDRPLFVDDAVPDDIEDLIDPPGAQDARLEPRVLGAPRYGFHALTDIGRMVDGHVSESATDLRYIRFLEEWDASSAGAQACFSDHFVLRLLPFLDRFGEHKIEATPLPVRVMDDPDPAVLQLSGAPLANFLHDYNIEAGYPLAWYFLMLITKKSMVDLAQTIYLDYQRNYRYLADRDIAVLEGWIRNPYSF